MIEEDAFVGEDGKIQIETSIGSCSSASTFGSIGSVGEMEENGKGRMPFSPSAFLSPADSQLTSSPAFHRALRRSTVDFLGSHSCLVLKSPLPSHELAHNKIGRAH